jgi:4-amino-4-deoxy-L-arabinose transferase-like glycosyltransferase
MKWRWRPSKQRAIGWALALFTVLLVTSNQRDVGIARDETVYFAAGTRYADWWLDLATFKHGITKKSIDATFGGEPGGGTNSEHPPLVKTAMGLSHWLLYKKLHVTDELTAFRFPGALLAGLLVLLVYSMTLALWGFPEAVLAALCTLLLPRALFHEGLACFDAPIMTLWFATIYAYWRCLDERKWPWQVGVVFGLALATKHNAVLLPFALGLHYLVVAWRAGRWRGLLHHKPRVVLSLAVLGPLTLFIVWPWLWFAPIAHVKQWLTFHLTHVHYNFEYLGDNWNAPRFPWHVALVTTLFTVPVATLAAAFTGAGVWLVRWRRGDSADHERAPALLLALSAAASIGPFFLGTTPIFGAEKHWMPALPTLTIAAGVGGVWAARRAADYLRARRPMSEQLAQRMCLAIVGGSIVLACATETVSAEPYALTWYNALAGEAPGGADLGMNRQFWGVSARGVLPFLGYQFPTRTYWHDASPAAGWYQQLGMIRGFPHSGQELPGIEASNLAIVIHEKHFNRHDYLIWRAYGTVKPVFVLRSEGVPIVTVYKRPVPR